MSGDDSPARRPGAAASSPAAGRRIRLATVVAVACAVAAAGVTGSGLLVAGGDPTPWLRIAAAFAGIAAAGVLVRLDGAARGVTTLAVVCGTAAVVCLATFPVSPVRLGPGHGSVPSEPPTDGEGQFGGGANPDAGAPDPRAPRPGALALPPGADVSLEAGGIVLELPDGARVVIGRAEPGAPGVPPEGTSLAIVDGVVTRGDGAPVGPDVPLGGTTLERGDGSAVAVGDGSLLDVPPPVPADDGTAADGLDALLALLLASFALLAFAPPLVRFAERHDLGVLDEPEPDTTGDEQSPEAVAMEDGLAEVLRSMLADPDPRTAVIGAYGRLLTALAEAGAPRRDEEGPHEHLWRSLGPLGVRRQPLHRLAELFVLARFTLHPVTESHRQAAIAALADAVGDLRLQAADVREAAAMVGVTGAGAVDTGVNGVGA